MNQINPHDKLPLCDLKIENQQKSTSALAEVLFSYAENLLILIFVTPS